jgi:hypothetical protein
MALVWEELEDVILDHHGKTHRMHVSSRAKIPGGWLIKTLETHGVGIVFYPDPNFMWDGSSPGGEEIVKPIASLLG